MVWDGAVWAFGMLPAAPRPPRAARAKAPFVLSRTPIIQAVYKKYDFVNFAFFSLFHEKIVYNGKD